MYVRKTKDMYSVMTNYGYGWEEEYTAFTWQEAKRVKQDYLLNTCASVRIDKHRERIGGENL